MATRRGKSEAARTLRNKQMTLEDIMKADPSQMNEDELRRAVMTLKAAQREAKKEEKTIRQLSSMAPRTRSSSPKAIGGPPPPPPPMTKGMKDKAATMAKKIAETKGSGGPQGFAAVLAEMNAGKKDLTKIDDKGPLVEEGKKILKEINGLLGYQEEPHVIDFDKLSVAKIKEKLGKLQEDLAIKKQLAKLRPVQRKQLDEEREELTLQIAASEQFLNTIKKQLGKKFKNTFVPADDTWSDHENDWDETPKRKTSNSRKREKAPSRSARRQSTGRKSSRKHIKSKKSKRRSKSKSRKMRRRSLKYRTLRRKSSKKSKKRKSKKGKKRRRSSQKMCFIM